ncbi:hypothetical protein [Enterovirga sp.]|uniref:hypothetical protein n=1 Tax=Enterovirga sp. TaxID=2026350 RepID=UPI002614AE43|nr:hypothetical protein [Enterovirga sp.]MDB5592627.1 hypothetical protein [Enterovirga sp.]
MAETGHNGGPPLEDEHVPEWGTGGIGNFFAWKVAHKATRTEVPWEIMLWRQRRAEALGLTYEEYSRELRERGRHVGPADAARVAAIKQARPVPTLIETRSRIGPGPVRGRAPQPGGPATRAPATSRGSGGGG